MYLYFRTIIMDFFSQLKVHSLPVMLYSLHCESRVTKFGSSWLAFRHIICCCTTGPDASSAVSSCQRTSSSVLDSFSKVSGGTIFGTATNNKSIIKCKLFYYIWYQQRLHCWYNYFYRNKNALRIRILYADTSD